MHQSNVTVNIRDSQSMRGSFVGFVDAQLQVFRTALEETDENDE